MAEYRVGTLEEIPEGGKKVFACGEVEVGLFKVKGEIYAWYNVCPHREGPVCQGRIYRKVLEPIAPDGTTRLLAYDEERPLIACPWHGYEFDIKTGHHPGRPALRLRKAPVRVVDGEVYVVV